MCLVLTPPSSATQRQRKQGQKIMWSGHMSSVALRDLGPTQRPIQWVSRAPSLEIKRQGHEADHSPPTSAEVNNGGPIPPLPHTV
jgi:hypothetical protein